jgi:hypothetical protein
MIFGTSLSNAIRCLGDTRILFLIALFASISFISGGCSERETLVVDEQVVELLPLDKVPQVNTNSVEIVGIASKEDIREVLELFSRIPGTGTNPPRIWFVWDGNPLAARIACKGHYVYVMKDRNGKWRIHSVTRVWSDNFSKQKNQFRPNQAVCRQSK